MAMSLIMTPSIAVNLLLIIVDTTLGICTAVDSVTPLWISNNFVSILPVRGDNSNIVEKENSDQDNSHDIARTFTLLIMLKWANYQEVRYL